MRNFRVLLFAVATLISVSIAARNVLAGWVALFAFSALLTVPRAGMCYIPTLTTAEIIADIFAAFKAMVPALKYFATDFNAERAKFDQQIIAHVASRPVAVDHDQNAGYFDNATNANTLLEDVPIKINVWKDIKLKFAQNNLVADRTTKYTETVNQGASVLGKCMVDSVLANVNSTNISNQLICADANANANKLRVFTAQLNTQKAAFPRFGLTSSGFMTNLLNDTIIASGDYHAQLQGENPFAVLQNINGFSQIAEYSDFPENSGVIGTFTAVAATDVITVSVAHGLVVGDRIRFTSADTLPAGLAVDTDYYVKTVPSATTLTVSETVGGATVDITDVGTGVHTIQRYDNLTAFFFERRCVAVASRLPTDSLELAQQRGVPVPMKIEVQTDAETGLSVLALERFNTSTLDLEICMSVMFGSAIGRQAGNANTKLDQAGLRIVKG